VGLRGGKSRVWTVLSPDEKWIYLTGFGIERGAKPAHAVYRVPLDLSAPAEVFFGKTAESGDGAAGLNQPKGVAFDARVEPGVRSGAPGFAVMVGRYVRFADAQEALGQLRRAGFEAFIVP